MSDFPIQLQSMFSTLRDGAAVYQAGKKTLVLIIDESLQLIEEEGMAGFSVRAVAQRMGKGVRSVQHYFPKRDDLLIAIIDKINADYASEYEVLYEQYQLDHLAHFNALITQLIAKHESRLAQFLLSENWDTATPELVEASRESLQAGITYLGYILHQCRSDLPQEECNNRCALITSLLQGYTSMVFGPQLEKKMLRQLRETTLAQINAIAFAA